MPLCYAARFQTSAKGRLLAKFEVTQQAVTDDRVLGNEFDLIVTTKSVFRCDARANELPAENHWHVWNRQKVSLTGGLNA